MLPFQKPICHSCQDIDWQHVQQLWWQNEWGLVYGCLCVGGLVSRLFIHGKGFLRESLPRWVRTMLPPWSSFDWKYSSLLADKHWYQCTHQRSEESRRLVFVTTIKHIEFLRSRMLRGIDAFWVFIIVIRMLGLMLL